MKDELIDFRKELHTYPELSGKEINTASTIYQFLKDLKPDLLFKNVGGTGVLATFSGNKPGPTVLFRCELDALPIQEVNTFSHRSVHDGVSHKCGHDGHMAIMCGLARLLKQSPDFNGRAAIIFQPAEENGIGAKAVLNDPIFSKLNPDYVFALHNIPGYPLSSVILTPNNFTAAVESMAITFNGKESHAAEPENGNNPAHAIAQLIVKLDSMSESAPDQDNLNLIVPVYGTLGTKDYGISPARGELHLTYRCWSNYGLEDLKSRIEETVNKVCIDQELHYEISTFDRYEAVENNNSCTDIIQSAAKDCNLSVIEKSHPFKFGEDFGAFTSQIKGAMFGIGAGENCPALHNPDYDFPDEIIIPAAKLFKQILVNVTSTTAHT